MQLISEGKAKIRLENTSKITKQMPVFYNPYMKLNRDISVLLLKSIGNSSMKIADPLAASGIRSIRFIKELKKSKINSVFINDMHPSAVRAIKNNLKVNCVSGRNIVIRNQEANLFLLQNKPFDYIDLDPFGSPVNFLDAAVKCLSRNAILAVTATDTAALSGTAKAACIRKYWATPLKNHLMHEVGLRILIRRVQLVAASHEKAMQPIYAYSNLHYMRVFFRCTKKNELVDKILGNHNYVVYCKKCFTLKLQKDKQCKHKTSLAAGPLWTSELFDPKIATAICKNNKDASIEKFLKTIMDESKINTLGFYDTHVIAGKLKASVPKLDHLMKELKSSSARTHLGSNSLRTKVESSSLINLIKRHHDQRN